MAELTAATIATLVELGEARAWASYYHCASLDFAARYGVQVKRLGPVWVTTMPGLDIPFMNRINGLGIGNPASETMLDDAIAVLEKAGSHNYMAQLSPAAQPSCLPAWLAARNMVKAKNWAKMYRGNEPAPAVPTTLRIEPVTLDYAETFAEVALTAFEMPVELCPMVASLVGMPGWNAYMAWDGRQPVATAALFVSGDVAWLGFGSTLESHRRRGAQSALFARRIEDGRRVGCRWFVTETGEDTPEDPNPSYHNMLHMGFKLAYQRPNFVHEAPAT